MSDNLVLTADAAYPFDYARLPAGVRVVLGYVGQAGCTPHIWTAGEIAAARHAVGAWSPIWTPPQGEFGDQNGLQAGNGTAAALRAMDYPTAAPVFLDIEHNTWSADPPRTMAGVHAWQATVKAAGWPVCYPYLPIAAGYGWAASWTGVRPVALPVGCIGQQYAGNAAGGLFDLSVFDPAVFAGLLNPTGDPLMALDTTDKTWLVQQITQSEENILNLLRAYYNNGHPDFHPQFTFQEIYNDCQEILSKVETLATPTVNAVELAAQLAAALGPELGGQVAAALAARLQS